MKEQYILLHGALHGGWCWQELIPYLKQQKPQAQIYTPDLLGLGQKQGADLSTVNLSAQIADMKEYIQTLPPIKTTLVAHSYGALVALCLHEQMPERFHEVILLDGLICDKGTKALDIWSEELREIRVNEAIWHKNTLCFFPTQAKNLGVPERFWQWMDANLTPHPVACYQEPMPLQKPLKYLHRIRYIQCYLPEYLTVTISVAYLKMLLDWPITRVACDHEGLITEPELVCQAILNS
ncbi:MAG: alpha/beta fold hydrolase [Vibrio sp.]